MREIVPLSAGGFLPPVGPIPAELTQISPKVLSAFSGFVPTMLVPGDASGKEDIACSRVYEDDLLKGGSRRVESTTAPFEAPAISRIGPQVPSRL